MKKKLFLHIGTNKTGTSAIQNYCNKFRPELVRSGLLYPHAGCLGEAHYNLSRSLGFSHQKLQKSERVNLQKQAMDELLGEIEYWNPSQIVFSSEMFILNGDVHEVANFFENFDVSIILYLRRHDAWWLSAYNQSVKQVKLPQWKPGFLSFVKFNEVKNPLYGNYRHLTDRWASVFGKEKLIVRPFESGQNMPNILTDFFMTMSRGDLSPQDVPRVNESLDAWTLNFIDFVQRSDIDDSSRKEVIQYALTHPHGGPAFRANSGILLKIIESHQADYEYIAREYLGRDDGKLFYDVLPFGEEDIKNARPTEPEIVSLMVKALAVNQSCGARV